MAASVDSAPRAFFTADPQAMSRVLSDLEGEHGSVRGFVGSIGVSDDALTRLDDLLLEAGLWGERERVLSVLATAATLDANELADIERRIETSVRRWPDIVAEAFRGRQGEGEEEIVAPMPREGVGDILGLPRVAAALS